MKIAIALVLFLGLAAATAQAEPAVTATRLLALYEQQLLATPVGSDVSAVEAELERLRAAGLPHLRLSQRATWDFDELVDLGIGASLSWGAVDPEAELRKALTAKRLELARHNHRSQLAARLLEFRRTLRLLAHLDEVERLLARHRQQLLALRPAWRELELVTAQRVASEAVVAGGGGTGVPLDDGPRSALPDALALEAGLDQEQVGYLEVVQALERTRRERSVLVLMVAGQVEVDPEELSGEFIGRAPMPEVDPAACLFGKVFENVETIRAKLLLEESRLTDQLEAARSLQQVTFDLSGNASYANSSFGSRPWRADLRLALQVALPATDGVSSDFSLAVTPGGFSQELSIAWPPRSSTEAPTTDEAERAYSRVIERARLNALRDLEAVQDARGRLLLRRAELGLARRGSTGAASDLNRLNQAAQAELALLNAGLEADLALMEVGANCDGGKVAANRRGGRR